MDIKDYYLKYIELKKEFPDFMVLESKFYEFLIRLIEIGKEDFNLMEIEEMFNKRPRCSDYENQDEYRTARTKWQSMKRKLFFDTGGFFSVHYLDKKEHQAEYLKLYFSVSNENRKRFLVDYCKFMLANNIAGSYKLRMHTQSDDAFVIRVYDPKEYDKVFEFVKHYADKNVSHHMFMPAIDGIGITIDDGGSYNKYVVDLLINYFNECDDVNQVSLSNFIKYMKSKKSIENMDRENSYHSIIYTMNIMNALKQGLKKEDVFCSIDNMQKNILECNVRKKTEDDINYVMYDSLNNGSYLGTLNSFNKLLYELTIPGIKEIDLSCISLLSNSLREIPGYNESINPFDYILMQLENIDTNLNRIIELLYDVFNQNGIEGLKSTICELESSKFSCLSKYGIKLEEIKLPILNTDKMHSNVSFVEPKISLKNILCRLRLLFGNEINQKLRGMDDADIIAEYISNNRMKTQCDKILL